MRNPIRRPLAAISWAVVASVAQAGCFDPQDPFEKPPAACILPPGGRALPALTVEPRAQVTVPAEWRSGRAMALAGDRLYVADADNGTLVKVDAKTLKVLAKHEVGGRPAQVVVGPDGTAFVTLRAAGKVLRIEPGHGFATAGGWQVGPEPVGLALSAGAKHLLVVVAGTRELLLLDANTGAVLGKAATGDRPIAVAVNDAGVAVVTDHAGPALVYKIDDLAAGKAAGAKALLDRRSASSACGDSQPESVHAVRATAVSVEPGTGYFRIAHVIASPGHAQGSVMAAFAAAKDSDDVPVSAADVAREAAQERCSNLGGVLPDGDGQGSGGGGGYGGSSSGSVVQSSDCAIPRRPIEVGVTLLNASGSRLPVGFSARRPVLEGDRALAARFDQPSSIVHHPTHRLTLMTAAGTDNVLVAADSSHGPVPLAMLQVGEAPRAVVVTPDGQRAFVLNGHAFTVSEVDLAPILATNTLARPLTLQPLRTVAFATDPLPADARLGRRTFHFAENARLSKRGQFACATCHLDGAEDKLTWFISDGPRQTPALAGRLDGTGPFNWKGTHDVLVNNMADTIHRMGGTGLTPAELASLEKFMQVGLPPPPNPHVQAQLTEAQARGKALFLDPVVACVSCHLPGSGTDGLLHDVGTSHPVDQQLSQFFGNGQPVRFNTPSLRGLHHTAPYLHDGSAQSLLDVLDRTGDTMGKTSHLDAGQKADLVAYLLTL